MAAISADQLKNVTVNRASGLQNTYTCVDDGEGLTKEDEGFLWVREVNWERGTQTDTNPEWRKICPVEDVEKVKVDDFKTSPEEPEE